jgi:hypothetical protein
MDTILNCEVQTSVSPVFWTKSHYFPYYINISYERKITDVNAFTKIVAIIALLSSLT